ncbi:MAG: two-component system, OmpR family, sensor histidine kinase MprB [Actinomycetota bacterium]|jgi:two-component system sensor histidine kinase MprB|nr:two-component system, OmpR family, sensor histidine kinase MprB [Actinomycetota bacterium]
MSLRFRLLLVVATTFAIVVVGCIYAAHVSTRRELRAETDRFLLQRAHDPGITSGFDHPPGPASTGVSGNKEPDDGPQLAEPDAVVQLLDAKGRVVRSIANQPAIPVDSRDKNIAAHGGDPRFRTVAISGTQYRVLTVSSPQGGAAQIARSIADTNNVLSALDLRLLLIALAGTAVAATSAWLIARRIVRPVEQLTVAAEQIAATQELEHHIEITRRDELGRLAASFNTMLAALGSSRAQQRRLVMDASHELRTPLTALRTNIELLQRAGTLDEAQRVELVDAAQVELAELGELVTELVDLATDARAEEPVQRVDVGDLIERVVERERRRSGRPIILTRDTDAVVNVRVSAIDRAVHNLLDNAGKFSPADTPIEVDVRGGIVEVRDRGVGVATDERSLVFDRFYRAAAARSQPGSGLGLAIVRQIAELHGGTVELLEREGGGTIARLTLPTTVDA